MSKTSPSGLDLLTVGGFLALHRPMVTLPPLAPTEHKLKGEELALYQFILISWSKGQSISRVQMMLVPRLSECY